MQAAGELTGNPQEPRKTRSQTSKASFASDSALAEHCYMLISSDPQTYHKYCTLYRTKMEVSNGRLASVPPREQYMGIGSRSSQEENFSMQMGVLNQT